MDLAAAKPEVIEQVRSFVRWVGTGRKLTQTGRVTLTDARTLVEELSTDDVIDPKIGDRVFRTPSSQELFQLMLIVEWAKAARLVRKTGNKLVPVKKNAALLDDPQALRHALFTAFDQVGEAFLPPGFGESLMRQDFAIGIRAVLTSLYRAGNAVPTATLCVTAWDVVTAPYVLDHATESQLSHWRAFNDRDTERALGVLGRLGAVTIDDGTVELTEFGRSGMRRLLGEPEPGSPVYQIKITLLEIENPPVWRRVLVPATVRLDRLHDIIQAAMGWQNSHMHAFIDGQTYYGVPDPDLGYRDERATRLNDLMQPGSRLLYVYDFGDYWEHEITVEEATVAEADMSYPLCVAGQGACPPEDSGGVPGYERLVQILTDPGQAEHQDMLNWLGLDDHRKFDPTHFTPDNANQRLTAAPQARPRVSRR